MNEYDMFHLSKEVIEHYTFDILSMKSNMILVQKNKMPKMLDKFSLSDVTVKMTIGFQI
jgi:hypothetical protein